MKILKQTERPLVQIIVYTVVTVSVIFSLLSLYVTVLNAFKNQKDIYDGIFSLPTSGIMWKNFGKAFSVIGSHLLKSVFVALMAAVSTVALGAMIAYIFSRKQFVGKEMFFFLYITVLLMPSITGIAVLYKFVIDLNIVDTYFAIWIPILSSGQVGVVFLFRTFFSQQPTSVFEAATIDGANDVNIFFNFVLPLAFPIIMLNFVSIFNSQYNDFLWPAMVIKSPEKMLLMTVLQRQTAVFEFNDEGVNYAMYLISGIPLIFTTAISLRFFKDGDFAAGMKL